MTIHRHLSYFNSKGFTLQEIVVAMIMVGVLAGLAMPRFGDSMRRVTNQEGEALLISIFDAQKEFEYETGAYTTNENLLDVTFTAPKHFNLPQAINGNVSCEGAGPANVISSIQRSDGTPYILYATTAGQIICCPATPGNDVCQRLGYDFGW